MRGPGRHTDSALARWLRRAWVFVASVALVGLLMLLPVPYLLDVFEVEGPYTTWALWGVFACLVCLVFFGLVHLAVEVYEAVREVLRS